jgi:malyl-CoA/(S)-citramalyl-CoA lyase
MEKAPALGADLVFLDLEDAVAPDDKEQARENVIEALLRLDWSAGAVSVRINGLDTHWCYRDVVEVMERAGDRLDTLLIPKVGSPADVGFVATLCSQIEQTRGLPPVNLHVLIETAKGMANVEAIARAVPERLEAMVFGVADYAASVQARTTNIGGANPDYGMLTDPSAETGARAFHWGDQWHFGISRMVAACRAEGLRPIDGP